MEEKEERSKVATIATIACAAVALIAIILFCVAFFGGGIGSSEELTTAPNLLGQIYDETKDYGDVQVELSGKQYSDTYAKGEIMDQNPKADKRMAKGGTIRVTISLGPEPVVKKMEDLTHVPQQQAMDFLTAMNINLQVFAQDGKQQHSGKGLRYPHRPHRGRGTGKRTNHPPLDQHRSLEADSQGSHSSGIQQGNGRKAHERLRLLQSHF